MDNQHWRVQRKNNQLPTDNITQSVGNNEGNYTTEQPKLNREPNKQPYRRAEYQGREDPLSIKNVILRRYYN